MSIRIYLCFKCLWVLLRYIRYFKIIIWHTFRELFCVSFSLVIRAFVVLNVLHITQIARLKCNYQWKLLLVFCSRLHWVIHLGPIMEMVDRNSPGYFLVSYVMLCKMAYMRCWQVLYNNCNSPSPNWCTTWWRHQMEAFSALLAIRAVNSPVTGKFPAQRPVTRSFDVFFDLRPAE